MIREIHETTDGRGIVCLFAENDEERQILEELARAQGPNGPGDDYRPSLEALSLERLREIGREDFDIEFPESATKDEMVDALVQAFEDEP